MSGKVALITGAGRGIGQAVAIELARRGFSLMLVSRTESELRETAEQAGKASYFVGNIAKPQAVKEAVSQCIKQFGRLDAVVHCAGYAPILKIAEATDEQWYETIDTNLSAAFFLARAAWPTFVQQKGGVIVNISSSAARDPFLGFTAYAAAKAGINLLGLERWAQKKKCGDGDSRAYDCTGVHRDENVSFDLFEGTISREADDDAGGRGAGGRTMRHRRVEIHQRRSDLATKNSLRGRTV